MRFWTTLLCISAAGYAVDHWGQLSGHHEAGPLPKHQVLVYGSKDKPPYVQLENELRKQNIPFQDRDTSQSDIATELVEKRARLGRTGVFRWPVVEVDGVLVENAKFWDISRRLH